MALAQPLSVDASVAPAAAGRDSARAQAWIAAATAVLGLSLLAAIASPLLHHVPAPPEDDADYYRVIAANIARTGASTFDGQTLTNGYHPLWAWVLALQDRLFGPSFTLTRLIEAALVTTAFPLLMLRSGMRSAAGIAVALALFGRLVAGLSLTGMEVSLLVGTTGLLLWLLGAPGASSPSRAAGIGAALAAAVLARIDAAVFLLPLVAFAPLSRPARLIALGTAGALGAAYVAYNVAVFGTALPVSSAVKSLGGLQLNRRLVDQIVSEALTQGLLGRHVQTALLLALSPLLFFLSRPRSLGRALAGATVLGGAVFVAKLLLASSWRVWPWYDFPVLFALSAALFVLGPRVEGWIAQRAPPLPRAAGPAVAAALLVLLCGKAALTLARPPANPPTRFDDVNREAIARFAPVLRGQRVAMGDRAGAFAAAYPGGVTQLEGLVNDVAWFKALKAGADLKPILCARGVRFVAAYARDLGAYETATVPALRPRLTQFRGPVLTLPRADEVGHFADRAAFDMRGVDDEDDVFYLWRLSGCPR